MVWSRASRYGSIYSGSLFTSSSENVDQRYFWNKGDFIFKTFYQMKEDRRPNASLGGKKGVGSSHPRDRVIPGRFARAHFL